MSIVMITGAATGIGRLTAETLAAAGHTVYATMRDPEGRDAPAASELAALARATGADLRVVALDVTSQDSAEDAVRHILGPPRPSSGRTWPRRRRSTRSPW
ncbi:SDR family NAD(P)-dependent oxidoreductase [Nonomuraea sp. NPDC048882]|uniref:SDR family NAD(P)-dependent oxidoreductase n=1 Tax=Nonomuraea sp. NPDC048882 TaxID=3154347 RepID=UPI0033F4CAC5